MRTVAFVFLLGPSLAVADPFYFDIPPEQDVIILGEVHDNPLHHRNQGLVIDTVTPSAIVFEMINPDLAALVSGQTLTLVEFIERTRWEAEGWPALTIYAGLFIEFVYEDYPRETAGEDQPDFVGDYRFILTNSTMRLPPIYGGHVNRQEAQRAFEVGAVSVFGPQGPLFGLGTDLPPEEQQAREHGQQDAHCGMLPSEMLPLFVDAQRLRDARLTEATLLALRETGGPVIVITGNGHARTDWGLPAVLQRVDPSLAVFSVGQIEGDQTDVPFDLIVTTPIQERPDPCAAFQN